MQKIQRKKIKEEVKIEANTRINLSVSLYIIANLDHLFFVNNTITTKIFYKNFIAFIVNFSYINLEYFITPVKAMIQTPFHSLE